jgi:arginine/lysine/ornithine decarboxylase
MVQVIVIVNYGATDSECVRIKAKAGYEKERLRMPEATTLEMATMYLFQARNENKSKTGDKGVIEAVSGSPKRLIFASEEIKARIMEGQENLFNFIYVVDVVVEVREGKPIAYKVIKFHERFKDE